MCCLVLGCRIASTDQQGDPATQTRVQLDRAYMQIPNDTKKYGGSVYQHGKWRDGWGNDFRVNTHKKGDYVWYEVRSPGPDGRFDTEDDIFRRSGPTP